MTTKEQAEKALDAFSEMTGRVYCLLGQLVSDKDAPVWKNLENDIKTIRAALLSNLTAPEEGEVAEAVAAAKDALDYWREELKSGDWSIDNCCPLFKFKHLETLIRAATAPIKTDVADQIRVWLKVQANTETETKSKAAFIEAHNAALKIIEAAPKQPDTAEKLAGVLRLAQHQFYLYERNHLAKTPPDIDKAETNRRMANQCAEALAEYEKLKGEKK